MERTAQVRMEGRLLPCKEECAIFTMAEHIVGQAIKMTVGSTRSVPFPADFFVPMGMERYNAHTYDGSWRNPLSTSLTGQEDSLPVLLDCRVLEINTSGEVQGRWQGQHLQVELGCRGSHGCARKCGIRKSEEMVANDANQPPQHPTNALVSSFHRVAKTNPFTQRTFSAKSPV